ncbi:hypothetical protein H8E77_30905 [bacterium]|nr:hypothetical protein [bacterium]
MFSLLRALLKREEETLVIYIRRLLAPLGRLFVVSWEFMLAVLYPKKGQRPWLLAVIALFLIISSCVSYSKLFHGCLLGMLTWLYTSLNLDNVMQGCFNCIKIPFKKLWIGNFLLVWVSLVLVGTIWKKIRDRGELEFGKGLKKFCKWTTDAINERTTCIHIAVNTPLIHIFHDKSDIESLSEYRDGSFEQEFCNPLCNALEQCKSEVGYVKFLYYSPEILRTKVPWFPAKDENNFKKYLIGIEEFKKDVVRRHIKGASSDVQIESFVSTIFRETSMLPLWIAVITGTQPPPYFSKENTVILALTNKQDLEKEPESSATNIQRKKFASQLAENVICIRSTTPDIVSFFDDVFMDMWKQEEINLEHILDLLHRCRRGENTEVLLREPYNAATHGKWEPDKPEHVLYSTKRI